MWIKRPIVEEFNKTAFSWELPTYLVWIFKFDNGYGARVVKHIDSACRPHDLWELSVVRFDDNDNYVQVGDTGITEDVIGYLNDEQVNELFDRIKRLENPKHREN